MPRTHPPSLLTIAKRTIRDERLVAKGDRVLVAVSGGPDSMALLHVLARLRRVVDFDLIAHGVDHGLRAAAAAELDLAESLARSLDVPFARTRVDVSPGGNVQARARSARWAALHAAAEAAGAGAIATAHHADDRAETVLVRLLRGASAAGLAVLPPRARIRGAPDRIRPFIRARRADVLAHLARHDVAFARDPSNEDRRFVRVRVRVEVLPLLAELDPKVVEHLTALADDLAALPSTSGLPRATRRAMVDLERSRSPSAEVLLPGGLVATYDHAQGGVVIGEAKRVAKDRRENRRGAAPHLEEGSETRQTRQGDQARSAFAKRNLDGRHLR